MDSSLLSSHGDVAVAGLHCTPSCVAYASFALASCAIVRQLTLVT